MLLALAIGAACRQDPAGTSAMLDVAAAPSVTLEALAGDGAPPALSGTIAFQSNRAGRNGIFTLDLASGAIQRLTAGGDYQGQYPAWAPDGRRLAFATTGFDRTTYDVAVLDVPSGEVLRVTADGAYDLHPAWSRDGGSVFFSSQRAGTQAVFRARVGALDEVALVSSSPGRALMPDAAPDDRRIAYVLGSEQGLRIVVHDLGSGATEAISPAGVDTADVRWSPDGSRLAFARMTRTGATLDLIDASGGGWRSLGLAGARIRQPAWSPDGRWIAAAAAPDGSDDWDLVLIDTGVPARVHRLTSGPWEDRAPSWRPVE